ncbi:MAG: hypothetical protein H6742_17995 [Alphaproteobacteria bacterium]|nr:hypothetical protein [Alphaproteobacteria bacterium]
MGAPTEGARLSTPAPSPAATARPAALPFAREARVQAPFVAAACALLLAVAVTWPVALDLSGSIVGHPGNDNWNHVWGHWWVAHELSQGQWPLHTKLLNHPEGGTLFYIDTAQAMLYAPITLAVGAPAAFNLTILMGLTLAGFSAWLLARSVSGDDVLSVLAMVVYGVSPHLLGQAYNGISETVCAGFFPLSLWCLLRLVERPTVGRALGLGLAGAATMITSWYFGLLTVLGSVLFMLWRLYTRHAVDWRAFLPRLGLSSVVAGILIAPFFALFRASLDAPDALVTRDPEFVKQSLIQHNVTDLSAFFTPGKVPSPDLKALYGEELLIVIYLGWIGLLLAFYAWAATRRWRSLRPWLLLGLVFFAFSLGPYLNIGGDYRTVFGHRIPLPFLAFFEAFPVFDRISHPFRFVTGVSLAVAVTAVVGLRHMLRDRPRGLRIGVVGLLCVAMLVETRVASPASLPVPHTSAHVPDAYAAMTEDPVEGAVLDLPLTLPNLERAVYVWYQSVHHRPVPWGLNDPMPRSLLVNRLTATLIRFEAVRAQSAPAMMPELDLAVGARTLELAGYRYIVVHERFYPPFKRDRVEATLTALLGEPRRWPEDRLLVYRLGD